MSVERISNLKKKIVSDNIDGMVITHMDYVRYFTGFTGSSGLLVVMAKQAFFLTDFRYVDQARKEVRGAKVIIANGDPLVALKDQTRLVRKNMKIGIDEEHFTLAQNKRLQTSWPDVLIVHASSLLADLGWVKDKNEIENITQAVNLSDTAFERILPLIVPGVREREVAAELEYQMLMLGSEKPAFETIVASGYRSAMPHGIASKKKIRNGEFVTFDFGATVNGYVSDMTRTVVVGKANARQKKIYSLVLKAQKAGIRKIKAGVAGKSVDNACRSIITKAGYGKNFGHGTGHGIGYYVHVGPRVSHQSDDILKLNHVITVEPGIYISGWGGVRIEDDVVVTRTGGRVLNQTPKKLLEL